MSNNTSLKSIKSGKKFSDFCFAVLFLFSLNITAQIRDTLSVRGYLLDANDKIPVPNATIVLEEGNSLLITKTDANGYFYFIFKYGLFKKPNLYFQSTKDFKTPFAPNGFFYANKQSIELEKSYTTTLEVSPVPECGSPVYPRILFKKNDICLMDSVIIDYVGEKKIYDKTISSILLIHKLLIDNPTVIIEIAGHCSSDETNVEQLSLYRTEFVKQILVSKGVDEKRLITKNFGKKKLKITDNEISKAKTKEEKEALHELNRRVVFRIISWDYKQN